MKKYQYDITILATTETEADGKMTALSTLAAKLSQKELSKLAHIVANDPVKTLAAKKYLGV
jgi:thiamine biosynthesis lipoprotein ApbE